jgi:hypothetical protein
MKKRDLTWRVAGAVLSLGACAAALTMDGSPLILLLFPLVLFGLTLMINGKRVAVAWRAERRGHFNTATVIHAERIRRHRRRADESDA